jgi:phosphoadenosine phosphosulfate reductase
VQAEDLLRRRGLWERMDRVVWAIEAEPGSEGMRLAAEHQVSLAPFFLVESEAGTQVYTSVLKVIAEVLAPAAPSPAAGEVDVAALDEELDGRGPEEIVARALSRYGKDCVLAFSGAEDVALIDMAARSGHPFRVLTLDTGRLHPETYRFLDKVRSHFGVELELWFPDAVRVEALVRKKGLFSFYDDGHGECCDVRKVGPLGRALSSCQAWMTGQRRDQSPTRTDVAVLQIDSNVGLDGQPLLKLNPLAAWSLQKVWSYIRANEVPYNQLHDQGFISIGCEPCTRQPRPGEHERAGRWWWEDSTKRECGLHLPK